MSFGQCLIHCATPSELLTKIAALNEAKDKEMQERNLMMIERDKISSFWEIKKEEYDKLRAEFRNKDRAMEELEEHHQLELKLCNQKLKHLLYEQQHAIATVKTDNEQALKLQRDQFSKREGELVNDKRALKDQVKEMGLSYEDIIRSVKMEHAKEVTKIRQEFDQNAKELQQKSDRKIKTLRDEMDLRRKSEIHEIEERKNVHVSELMKNHEKAFTEIKCYYNDITHNNLDLIRTLKEDVTGMKMREAANEKLMYEIAQENKRLTEPLEKALKEVEVLRLGMANYEKDKQLLSQANSRQKESTKKFKQLEWDYQVLQSRCEQLQAERDEIFSKFVSSVHDVQQKCGLQSMLLQRKVQVLGEKLEKKEAQLGTGEVQGGVHSSAEKVLESKNNLIKSLRYDLGKILKVVVLSVCLGKNVVSICKICPCEFCFISCTVQSIYGNKTILLVGRHTMMLSRRTKKKWQNMESHLKRWV
ncbi:dynein regulatory complex subunit 4 isoform X2 [Physcomitrium patens]|uniref:dynein regulatory complex subunit 4 isoform X2 n=1 Tax=Physcomitrium patens TaxID=3218 RepID=UPI000D1758A2|nr:growth arrest-specific protein 8 homolog isoform X2 [Physcomitrium patens]|eukprot:XP_024399532.1 growth arrest-specific protein 8 homolog isoform X2 [Physcomitrella patens]